MILGRGDVVRGRKPLWTFTLCGYFRSVVAEEHQRSCDLLQLLRRVDCMFGSLSQETVCFQPDFCMGQAWPARCYVNATSMHPSVSILQMAYSVTAVWQRKNWGRTLLLRLFSKNSTQLILILSNRMEKVFCAVGATEEMYGMRYLYWQRTAGVHYYSLSAISFWCFSTPLTLGFREVIPVTSCSWEVGVGVGGRGWLHGWDGEV